MEPRKLFSSSSHSGCLCPISGYVCFNIRGNPLLKWGSGSCFPVLYTVVVCTHTVVMCVLIQEGTPYNMGLRKLFSGIVHSSCVYPLPTQWLCVQFYRGEPLINMGLRKLFSSSVYSGCVYPHSGYERCFKRGNPFLTWGYESCLPVVYTVVVYAHTMGMCIVYRG